MKNLVCYTSQTGFTRQYAQWVAQELGCPCEEAKRVSQEALGQADRVIYGGWVFGDTIMGLQEIRRRGAGQLVVFAVGASKPEQAVLERVRQRNRLEADVPFFLLEGGLRRERLGAVQRLLLSMVARSLGKKKDRTPGEAEMARQLTVSFDHADRSQLEPLLRFCR